MKKVRLQAIDARKEEIFKDIVRVLDKNRKDQDGEPIKNGAICKISVGKESALVILRGTNTNETRERGDVILIDDEVRKKLKIEPGNNYGFSFETKCYYPFIFGWSATDPGYRISYQVAAVSLFLGLLSMLK